ncbi:MAG: hypothetical protein EI684_20015 [Candidatus Viridilinea halotolerans]|uniref:PPM-type phosphatase domain-containing protein n=1 Tax=Candidatus Viridilinea halotolerans TaxID=2491704 RepID=A0A426TSD1_9CHLR|nr:MAG: hypothetical protein EI684_20015 [Candidatus Viridilinea halotolerans]
MSVAPSQPAPAPPASGERVNLRFGACTDTAGRPANEDNCTIEAKPRAGREHLGVIGAVADGMGGGEAGKTASNIAIGSIDEGYFESGNDNPLQSLQHAISQANSAVYAFTVNARKSGTVGTTMVAAAIVGSRAYIVNIGDSRAYLVRSGQAHQITVDHNWANQQVDLGRMTQEQAFAHDNAPLLTHVLGQGASLQIQQSGQPDGKFSFQLDLQPGDAIVLCSDGVSGVVGNQEIASLAVSALAPKAAEQIVARAKARRTTDNATAVVFQYGVRPKGGGGGLPVWLLPAGAGLVVLLLVFMVASAFAFGGGDDEAGSNGQGGPPPTSASVQGGSAGPGGIILADTPTVGAETQPAQTDGRATSTTLPATATSEPPTPTNTALPRPTTPPGQVRPTTPPVVRSTSPPAVVPTAGAPPTPTAVPPPPPTDVPPPPPTDVPPPPPTDVPPPPPTVAPPPTVVTPPPPRGDGGGGGGDGGGGGGGGGGDSPPPDDGGGDRD